VRQKKIKKKGADLPRDQRPSPLSQFSHGELTMAHIKAYLLFMVAATLQTVFKVVTKLSQMFRDAEPGFPVSISRERKISL
jgi:hypothetical protein